MALLCISVCRQPSTTSSDFLVAVPSAGVAVAVPLAAEGLGVTEDSAAVDSVEEDSVEVSLPEEQAVRTASRLGPLYLRPRSCRGIHSPLIR